MSKGSDKKDVKLEKQKETVKPPKGPSISVPLRKEI